MSIRYNRFGVPLDTSGYAYSLLQNEKQCYLCGRNGSYDPLNRHECLHGAYRQKSKELGLWVYLCHNRCHQFGKRSAHQCAETDLYLKRKAQQAAMEAYGWTTEEWIAEYGKNYLGDNECI